MNRIDRRDLLKSVGAGAAGMALAGIGRGAAAPKGRAPNIVIIMTDQQRAELRKSQGCPLDTMPLLDSLAAGGVEFNRAYTCNPTCVPARVGMLTGRFGSANRVRTNHNAADAYFLKDLPGALRAAGYAVGMSGKNHSHLKAGDFDFHFPLGHGGGSGLDRSEQEKAFDQWLTALAHRTSLVPTPFPLECQGPYRAVAKAQEWIGSLQRDAENRKPFLLWLTFAEPHNPYQVPKPYFDMFPPDQLPRPRTTAADIDRKGPVHRWLYDTWHKVLPDYDQQLARTRSNYFGMLRLIDDQIKRFVTFLDAQGLRKDTIIVFVSDHGDFVGEYGLIRKGAGVDECLARIPMVWTGPGVKAGLKPDAHVSLVDVMPTLLDMAGVEMPEGVQGRTLRAILTGGQYAAKDFSSILVEQGYGGLKITGNDDLDLREEGAVNTGATFDCLNSWTQSGTLRAVRKGDWKLVLDAEGNGQLYHLAEDPAEVNNRFNDESCCAAREEMMVELARWLIQVQDPLPYPRARYAFKRNPLTYPMPADKLLWKQP